MTFQVRFGVMVIGPTFGGKTTVYEVLRDSHKLLRELGSDNDDY